MLKRPLSDISFNPLLSDISAAQAHRIGLRYLAVKTRIPEAHDKAWHFFTYAYDRGFVESALYLGQLYATEGRTQSAAKLFLKAHEKNVLPPDFQTTVVIYNYMGLIGKSEQSTQWFEKARKLNPKDAAWHLANCYADSSEGYFDLLKAIEQYETAMALGSEYAKERLYSLLTGLDFACHKSPEKDLSNKNFYKKIALKYIKFMQTYYPRQLHAPLINGNTLLHEVTKIPPISFSYKTCARLMLLGANVDAVNPRQETPFSSLTTEQIVTISALETRVARMVTDLLQPPALILADSVTVDHGVILKSYLVSMFESLYSLPDIVPLLDLAKLCALGLHRLASEPSQTQKLDYDSDHDAFFEESMASKCEKLSIRIDPTRDSISRLFYAKPKSDRVMQGIYCRRKPTRNMIFIGAQTDGTIASRDIVRGVLLHEMTHFLTQEYYNNQCLPYIEMDRSREALLEEISTELFKTSDLDPILMDILRRYDKSHYHEELIARVPHIIVAYANSSSLTGIQRLEKQAPRLLSFYRTKFLPDLIAHTQNLTEQAMKGWPLALFQQENRRSFKI